MIREGMTSECGMTVTEKDTAECMASGRLPVLGTPAMVLLMERTAAECIQPFLPEGKSSVGISLNVRHTAPSPIGAEVRCKAELVGIDRCRMTFSVNVWDDAGEIGSGTHERFLIDDDAFMRKARTRSCDHGGTVQ